VQAVEERPASRIRVRGAAQKIVEATVGEAGEGEGRTCSVLYGTAIPSGVAGWRVNVSLSLLGALIR
jgi:hypothetical protein